MRVTNRVIAKHVVLIQRSPGVPTVAFYVTKRVIVSGTRAWLSESYEKGTRFRFPKGYAAVFCEILPTSESIALARDGKFPNAGQLATDRISIRQLNSGEHLGVYWDDCSSDINFIAARTRIVGRYRSALPMSAALQDIGVPSEDVGDILAEMTTSFEVAGL